MPKNDDQLSILGFGCMRLPINPDRSINEKEATAQIRCAIDCGVNYIDTAWVYHNLESEPFLSRALADNYREKVKLATKLPSWDINTREDMDFYLNEQLRKLNTDHIDYYLLHGLSGELWSKLKSLGVIEFLNTAKTDGRIINAGFSFHGTHDDFRDIVDDNAWDFCQIQYNFLDTHRQAGTAGLKYAASKGLGVIVMEPLRGGKLASPVPSEVQEIWNTSETKRTPAEWALSWVWNHPEVTVVLSGMNNMDHVIENIVIAGGAFPDMLTEEDLALVKEVRRKYEAIMQIGCTGCRYCMPCPRNVNIPECFETYNTYHMYQDKDDILFGYTLRQTGYTSNTEYGFASQCVECGRCVEICPQELDIIELLKLVKEDLENEGHENRLGIMKMIFNK